jgi:translocation and assembly module TamA
MRRAALLSLALLAGCSTPRGTADEPVITRLDLKGVEAVEAEELAEKLATHGPDCVIWGIGCDWFRLDPDALSVDKRRIEAFYRERGYYGAVVDRVEVEPAGVGRVRVALHVLEGKPVRVSRVVVEGLDEAPAARALVARFAIKVGDVFSEAAFDRGRAQLQSALVSTGYADAKVTQSAQVLPEEGTAEARYLVEAGARYRFGRVFVAGTAAVPKQKVIAQASREVKTGEWYDEKKLEQAQARVFDLGVFSGVRVGRAPVDEVRAAVPVVVSVREAPFRTLRVGPAIGFQVNRWEVQGVASWTHRNWLGSLEKLQLDLRAGYAWIPDPFSPSREGFVGQLSSEFSQPGVIGDLIDLTLRVELERSLQEAYAYYSERFRVGTPVRLARRWTLVPSYNLEVYQMDSVLESTDTVPPQLRNCPGDVCLLSYLEQRVIWDGRDDPINTTRGQYASFSVQEGFRIYQHGYNYLKFQPELRHFQPLGRDAVLAVRARIGAIVPLGEVDPAPVMALFTSGGPLSMRGYGSGRLSPMALQDGRWVPTGGNGLVDASVEARKAFTPTLVGAVFLDAGNVSDVVDADGHATPWFNALDPTLLQLALGVGLRYRTPLGPARFDVAMRLPTDWSTSVPWNQRFPPVPGSSNHREPIAAIHISLGEAF